MGRKYYYPRKHKYRSSGSGGIASLLFSALSGRRSNHHYDSYGYRPRRSGSLKSSLLRYVLKAVLKKVFK
jgi:hypothetical protein